MGLVMVKLIRDDDTVIDKPIQSIDFSLLSLNPKNFDSIIDQILNPEFKFDALTSSQIKQIIERLIPDLPRLLVSPECIPGTFILRINERLVCDDSLRRSSGNDGVLLLDSIIDLYAACVAYAYKSETLYRLMGDMIQYLTHNITSSLNYDKRESATTIIINLHKALDKASSVAPAKFSVNKDALSSCIIRACCCSLVQLESLCKSQLRWIKNIIDLNLDLIVDKACRDVSDIHTLHRLGYRDYILVNMDKIVDKACRDVSDIHTLHRLGYRDYIVVNMDKILSKIPLLSIHESAQLKLIFHPDLPKELDNSITSRTVREPAPKQDTGLMWNGL